MKIAKDAPPFGLMRTQRAATLRERRGYQQAKASILSRHSLTVAAPLCSPSCVRSFFRRALSSGRKGTVAFTLIELLVVIAMISVLAALLLPALTQAKASAKSAACKNNLRQVGLNLAMYAADFDSYPWWGFFGEMALLHYSGTSHKLLLCPTAPPEGAVEPLNILKAGTCSISPAAG